MKLKAFFMFALLFPMVFVGQKKMEIFFDFDKYDLNPVAQSQLTEWVAANKNMEVSRIYGYCDSKGTNAYNDTLSLRRVKSVHDFLQQNAISILPDYEEKGFGEDFKQADEQSLNRKVRIVYDVKKEEMPVAKMPTDSEIFLENVKTAKTGDKIKLKNINFFNMSPRILPKSKATLHDLLCAMQDNPKLKIEIQGHICCQDGDKQDLSTQRAKAIYNHLVSNKINRKRLSFKGFGTSNPIHPIPEKSEAEEEENRRVEILIVEN